MNKQGIVFRIMELLWEWQEWLERRGHRRDRNHGIGWNDGTTSRIDVLTEPNVLESQIWGTWQSKRQEGWDRLEEAKGLDRLDPLRLLYRNRDFLGCKRMFRTISTVKTTITPRASSVAAVLRSGLQPMEALRCDVTLAAPRDSGTGWTLSCGQL